MTFLSQAPLLGSLLLPHGAFQEHAAHTLEWSGMLSSKGSSGTCMPEGGFPHSYRPLSRRTQSPPYVGMGHFSVVWWHCLMASVGDGLLVLLIFLAGWLALHRRDWINRPGIRGYVLMLAVGLSTSVSVEWVAVHVMGEWAYTAQMPLVPGLGVGVMPVAQMLVLPPLIFRIVAVWRRRASTGPYN
jgi:hypothetical protein